MDKSPDAFRTISEVADLLDTPAHVLRFWESRFPQIKPVKRAGGRRYYRPADMALLSGIRRLLHEEGMTIRGVQKILREQGVKHVSGLAEDEDAEAEMIDAEAADAASEAKTVAPIPLFPSKAAPAQDPEPDAEEASDATVAAMHENMDAERGAAQAADARAAARSPAEPPRAPLSEAEEQALQTALSGPFGTAEPLPEPPPEAEVVQPVAPPQAAADTVTEPEAAAPEFAFDATEQDAVPEVEPEQARESVGLFDGDSVPVDDLGPAPRPETTAPASAVGPERELVAAQQAQPDTDVGQTAAQADTEAPAKPSLPGPLPMFQEITGHWLPADLRALRRGALSQKRGQAEALMRRLEQLRNRVGDLGRVPRR